MREITKETKQAIGNALRDFHPKFKADVWGRVELEGDFNHDGCTSDILVAGYADQERLTFLITVSSNDRNIIGVEQSQRLWRQPVFASI